MHVVNIFVRYDRDDTMDVKKLKRKWQNMERLKV